MGRGSAATIFVSSCLAVVALLHASAAAQSRTAVIEPSGEDQQLNAALERAIRASLTELGVGGDIASSPLGWSDLQLAAGCHGEGTACFAEIAAQLGVAELVLASAEPTPDDCVVELVRWRDGHVERRVLHERGETARVAILRSVGPALRELYELPPLPPPEETPPLPRIAPPSEAGPSPDVMGPIAIGAASLAALGAALAFTIASDASRTAWQTGPTGTMRDVDLTLAARDRAEAEAIAADVLFAAAAAGAVAATVWLVLELTHRADAELARGWLAPRWSL